MLASRLVARRNTPLIVHSTTNQRCHEISSRFTCINLLIVLLLLILAAAAPAQVKPPAGQEGAAPAVPPKTLTLGEYNIRAYQQETEGSVRKLRGLPGLPVEIESSAMLLRANEIDYDEETGEAHARGNVYFHQFEKNEQLWADRAD